MSQDIARRRLVRIALLMIAALAISTSVGCLSFLRGGSNTDGPRGIGSTTASGTGSNANASTALVHPVPLAGKVMPPPSGAYLGVYTPPAPFVLSPLDSFDAVARKNSAIAMWYQPWAKNNRSRVDAGAIVAVMRRGKIPMITWEPWDPGNDARTVTNATDQSAYRLSAIVGGQYDAYIRQWARDVKALGGPVMLRPMHEMNGDWYPWDGTVNGNTPALFVAAWRHMHDLFAQEGATNVTWVWSINHESVPDTSANRYAAYYPGDEYVDWVGVSGFNWGTSIARSHWQTFGYWYRPPLAYLRTLNKPIVIAEMGSVENGGDKAAWITDAYARIRSEFPEVKAVIYYNAVEQASSSTQDWRVDTTPASLAAFQSAIASPYFVGTAPAVLTQWQSLLGADDLRYLILFKPLY